MIDASGIFSEITLSWMPEDLTDDISHWLVISFCFGNG